MKILCILYDDPKTVMPKRYALDDIPKLEKYPDEMTLPSPKEIDFTPGELLGCVSGELVLHKFHEENGQVCPANWKKGQAAMNESHQGAADYLSSL